MPATHEVINQVPTLVNHDLADDPALLEGLRREGAADAEPELRALGTLAGSEQAQEWGRLAHAYPPILRTHDRYGHRIDEVEFNPVWHQLMEVAVSHGIHGTPWRESQPGAHVARAAKMYVWGQVEPGHTCPISMTYAAIPALRHSSALSTVYEPLLTAPVYDYG